MDFIFGKKKESHNDNVIQDVQEISPQKADNDIVNTRFLNWYVKGLHKSYPQWMKYDCGINDPNLKEQQMVERELLYHTGTFKGVTDCVLTDKGHDYLNSHSEILVVLDFIQYGVTFDHYYAEKKLHEIGTPPEAILEFILDKRLSEYPAKNMYGLYRCALLSKAEYYETKNRIDESLQFYLYTMRMDLTGLDNNGMLSAADLTIALAIKRALYKYRENCTNKMIDNCKQLNIPKSILSFATFKKVVNDIMSGKDTDINDYVSARTLKKYEEPIPIEKELDREIKKLDKEIDADMPFDEWVKKHKRK